MIAHSYSTLFRQLILVVICALGLCLQSWSMSSSSGSMVTSEMLQKLNALRQPCQFYGTAKGCKRGAKCKFSHDTESKNTSKERKYFYSIWKDESGKEHLVPRIPLTEALKLSFDEQGVPFRFQTPYKSWTLKDGTHLVTYTFDPARVPQVSTMAYERKTETQVILSDETGKEHMKGVCGARALPQYMAHGTSATTGLAIALDGQVNPSNEGKCGQGCYGFEAIAEACVDGKATLTGLDCDMRPAIEQAWYRCTTGGYNSGCIVTWSPVGIMVNRVSQNTVVVEGVTTYDGKDQFCTNSSSLELQTITFNTDALTSLLQHNLDLHGYTAEVHAQLKAMRQQVSESSTNEVRNDAKPTTRKRQAELSPSRVADTGPTWGTCRIVTIQWRGKIVNVVKDKHVGEHWVPFKQGRWWNMDTELWGDGPPKRAKREALVGEEMMSSISENEDTQG